MLMNRISPPHQRLPGYKTDGDRKGVGIYCKPFWRMSQYVASSARHDQSAQATRFFQAVWFVVPAPDVRRSCFAGADLRRAEHQLTAEAMPDGGSTGLPAGGTGTEGA
jgi:hypothetical protein